MTSQGGLGGSTLPSLTGTITGVGLGAAILPKTGSNMVVEALIVAAAAGIAMLVSMSVSKIARKSSR